MKGRSGVAAQLWQSAATTLSSKGAGMEIVCDSLDAAFLVLLWGSNHAFLQLALSMVLGCYGLISAGPSCAELCDCF